MKKYDVRCGDWCATIEVEYDCPRLDLIAKKFEETAKIDTKYCGIVLINEVGNSDIRKISWTSTEHILSWTDLDIYPKNIDYNKFDSTDIRIVKKGIERIIDE